MRHKMKQKDLAKELGISISNLSKIENGNISCSSLIVERFKSAFHFMLTDDDYQEIYRYEVGDKKEKEMKSGKPIYDNSFLVKFRKEHDLTQAQVAAKTGFVSSYISNLEVGRNTISPEFYQKFSNAYASIFTKEEQEAYSSYTGLTISSDEEKPAPYQSFGNILKQIRLQHNLTQNEVAKSLNIGTYFWNQYELGKRLISSSVLYSFIEKYSLTEEEKERLFSAISNQLPDYSQRMVQNFVFTNELETILMNFETIKLSKEEVKILFQNALEQAKMLKKSK